MRLSSGLRGMLACLACAGALSLAACRPPEPPVSWPQRELESLTLRTRLAQMVVAAAPTGRLDAPSVLQLTEWVRRDSIGGVLLPPGEAAATAAATEALHRESGLPLLVAAPIDHGLGEWIRGATELPSAIAVATLGGPDAATRMAARTAREAALLGVNLGLLQGIPTNDDEPPPLLALSPERSESGMRALVRGLEAGGVLTSVTVLTAVGGGASVPTLRWDWARWAAVELPMVGSLIAAGATALQPGGLVAPALTGDASTPLPFSAAAIGGLLRRDLGWEGLVIMDLRASSPLVREHGEAEAAVRAVEAGADLLLGVADPRAVVDSLARAVESGRIPAARVEQAVERVLGAKLRARATPATPPPAGPATGLRDAEGEALAGELARATLIRRGEVAPVSGRTTVVTPLGRGRTLVSELSARVPGLRHLPINPTADTAVLRAALRRELADSQTVILAEFPRLVGVTLEDLLEGQGEGRAARLLLLRFDVEEPVPQERTEGILLSWGTGATAQRLAVEALFEPRLGWPPPAAYRWPPARMLHEVDPAAVGMSAEALSKVDAVLREAIRDEVFPGAALAVGRRGGLVRLRGYGWTSREDDAVQVSGARTIYDIASLSKVVGTTAAVMALVEDGKLELDAPVRRYLPAFEGEGKERVTVRHLLTHTSGLPAGAWLYGSASSPEDAVQRVLRARLRTAPGEKVVYSDFGMILMKEIVERVAEAPMDQLLAGRVFAPLGMSSTMFLPPLALRGRIAPSAIVPEREYVLQGVVHDGNAFRLGGVAGHAGLFSTARDVAVFAQTMLNQGAYGTARLFEPGVVNAFATRQPGAEERALGWDTPSAGRSSAGAFFSARSFGHTGFTGTSLWTDPQKELFVVLLTNRTYDEGSSGAMLRVRAALHDAVAQAITDQPVEPRTPRPPARRRRR